MSIKLVIVALLAATALTTGAAARGKTATTLHCSGADNKDKCDCVEQADKEITRLFNKYVVGQCKKKSNEFGYGIVDDCTPGDEIVVRSAKNPTCAKQEMLFETTCKPLVYEGLTCQGDTISLVGECSTGDCSKCSSLLTIPTTDVTTCYAVDHTLFYKLAEAVPDCSSGNSIKFNQYTDKECSKPLTGNPTVTKPIQCTAATSGAVYGKAVCNKEEKKVSLTFCGTSDCSAKNCAPVQEVTFGVPKTLKDLDNIVVSVEDCESGQPIRVLGHYTGRGYPSSCGEHEGTFSKGTCEYMTATATIPTTATSSGGDNSSSGGDNSSSGGDNSSSGGDNSSSGGDNSSSGGEENNNTTTNSTDGVSLATAHSVAVLALVVCLLVYW